MASPSSSLPIRSISLPSRIHPTSLKLESALTHLKSSHTTSSTTSEAIQHSMITLAEMYNCLQDFLKSPQTQRVENHEDILNDSVTLLDSFDFTRDTIVTMKEHLQSLQSSLRRHRGFESQVSAYLSFRKKTKKNISIHLNTIKKLESKIGSLDESIHDSSSVAFVLREASFMTISVLKSVLVFLSMPKTRCGPFSLISRMVSMEKGENKKMVNEVGSVDLGLCSFKISDSKVVQNMLENLDARISGIESGLDCVFKCLVQNRVTLLNIMTQ